MLNNNIENINNKFITLLINYTLFFFNNIDLYKNRNFIENLYIKGLDIIKNIFNISLLHLENITDIYNLCEKGYIYFIEFINQISLSYSIENSFDLTIKDAIIFCYKKTILLFENKLVCNSENGNNNLYKIIYIYTNIISNLFINTHINNYNIINKNYSDFNNDLNYEKEMLKSLTQNINENNKKINKLNKKLNDAINFQSLSLDNYDTIIIILNNLLEFINKTNNILIEKNITGDMLINILDKYMIKNIYVFNNNKIINYEILNDLVDILNLDNEKFNNKTFNKLLENFYI